ncbi:MAG: DUF6057 family protein [Prevotellaceae bacterium]|nr:DUF6057 family protein [Prevotellaceae bacterium]
MTHRSDISDNSTIIKFICAIVFISFTFIYLYFFQADILAMEQRVLSGGVTQYDKTIGALVITAILYLVQLGVNRLTCFKGSMYALTFFPSLVLLTLLTSVSNDFDVSKSFGAWIWIAPVLLILYICLAVVFNRNKILDLSVFKCPFPRLLSINLLIMALSFLMVCFGGNDDEVFHYRMRVETLLNENEYDKALEVGEKSYNTDKSLTMLRIYALSKKRQLGERLFEYPLEGKSDALLPDGRDVRCLLFSEDNILKQLSIRKKGSMPSMQYLSYISKSGLAMKSVTDYLLCGYLLDKNLDAFVSEIQKKYNLELPTLPKHYREALTLYTHIRSNPVIVYHSEVMDADYSDFQALEKKYTDKAEQAAYVRDTYGDTYWFYYFYE